MVHSNPFSACVRLFQYKKSKNSFKISRLVILLRSDWPSILTIRLILKILCLIFLISFPLSSFAIPYRDYLDIQPVKQRIAYYALLFGYDPSVLLAVAECESNFQLDATNTNANGTVDYGVFQINSIHKKLARLNGLNIKNPYDNITLAFILLRDNGLSPWKASAKCVENKTGHSWPSWNWQDTS